MRDWERPKGPVRVVLADGREVGIAPSYWEGITMWSPGCTIVEITQEQYDREMTDWHRSLAEQGLIQRC